MLSCYYCCFYYLHYQYESVKEANMIFTVSMLSKFETIVFAITQTFLLLFNLIKFNSLYMW